MSGSHWWPSQSLSKTYAHKYFGVPKKSHPFKFCLLTFALPGETLTQIARECQLSWGCCWCFNVVECNQLLEGSYYPFSTIHSHVRIITNTRVPHDLILTRHSLTSSKSKRALVELRHECEIPRKYTILECSKEETWFEEERTSVSRTSYLFRKCVPSGKTAEFEIRFARLSLLFLLIWHLPLFSCLKKKWIADFNLTRHSLPFFWFWRAWSCWLKEEKHFSQEQHTYLRSCQWENWRT